MLKDKLGGVVYHADNTSAWCREIADEIKQKLKGMGLERYKFVVQVGHYNLSIPFQPNFKPLKPSVP